ncbi:MAG TPA: VWA domain-containing protein [Candidatus Anoxymicrobiaceae bacterium]
MAIDERVLSFIDKLRDSGLQVSLAESIDAFEALKVVPMDAMLPFKMALRATLIKSDSDFPLFDALFDNYFTGSEAMLARPDMEGEEGDRQAPDTGELSDMVRDALMSGNGEEIAEMARMAAFAIGTMEGGFGGGGRPLPMMAGPGYYMFKGMEMLDFKKMSAELEGMAAEGQLSQDLPPALALEQLQERMAEFSRLMDREIRRLIAIERGTDVVLRRDRLPARPEEVEFLSASLKQVEEMRRVLPSLARKLAARIARRNNVGRRGRVDVRNTLRHSISTGGVPLEVKYKKRVPSKPELWVLCDVSGSVRTFSTFTLQLVYSLHQQFKAVRSFVFIDRVDEVTDCFANFDIGEAVEEVYRGATVVDGDGHSDIGRALEMFNTDYSRELGPRSTVLILSDARNNARDPRAEALEIIGERSRKVFWLNPESRDRWDTGDSVISAYTAHCDEVQECRNLKQLADFVYRRA